MPDKRRVVKLHTLDEYRTLINKRGVQWASCAMATPKDDKPKDERNRPYLMPILKQTLRSKTITVAVQSTNQAKLFFHYAFDRFNPNIQLVEYVTINVPCSTNKSTGEF